jgi:hypothetical protein
MSEPMIAYTILGIIAAGTAAMAIGAILLGPRFQAPRKH